jgi:ComF family protein
LSNRLRSAFDCAARSTRSGARDTARSAWSLLAGGTARIVRRALPQACALCAAPAGDALVCAACAATLPRVQSPCPVCALPTAEAAVCGGCLRKPPAFAATLAAFIYAFPVDRLLQQLKYGGRLAYADWAAEALAATADAALRARSAAAAPECVVALPLSATRQRERGFNQAREIGVRVARRLGLPVARALERVAVGVPQTALPWSARARNVRGAFACRERIDGARIALVDDVMTTGATLAEAALTLRAAGAARVECWVVARTLPPRSS